MQQDPPCGENASGERDGDDVVAGGPPQVLDHLAIGGLAQFDDRWHVARVAAHEYDVAGLDRDVRPCADGDADVGREQRRSVIDTVTHHRDALALGLQLLDLCHLVLGQYLGEDGVDVEFLRDRVCDRRGITRQQDNLQSFVVQPLDRVERFGTDGIRDRKYGEHPVAFADHDGDVEAHQRSHSTR